MQFVRTTTLLVGSSYANSTQSDAAAVDWILRNDPDVAFGAILKRVATVRPDVAVVDSLYPVAMPSVVLFKVNARVAYPSVIDGHVSGAMVVPDVQRLLMTPLIASTNGNDAEFIGM
jgi:hypothetical protein